MDKEIRTIIEWIIFGGISLSPLLGVEVWDYRNCRKEGTKYIPLIYGVPISFTRELWGLAASWPKRLIGTSKVSRYQKRYPLQIDSEGYILEDDAPLLEQNDHLAVRESNGFVIGGKNEKAVIESLEKLVGFTVEELERRMYPDHQTSIESGMSGYVGSNSSFGGFLEEGEELIPYLLNDNELVAVGQ